MAKTLRDNPDTSQGGTLRGNPNNQGGTLRGTPANKGGTLRGTPGAKGGTLRGTPGAKGGTLRGTPGAKGGTLRDKPKNKPSDHKPEAEAIQPKVLKKELQPAELTEITLSGVSYKIDGLLSASTGEAQIYLLSRGDAKYVLKLYYAGMSPNPAVMEILKANQGTGFLVDILDAGQWTSPQGEVRDYELQPYYSGGELAPRQMAGNPDALKIAAASMMMAINTAHAHGILHKDVKPGNFFYTDESRTQLVLADFGISSAFSRDAQGRMLPLKSHVQWRTKIYAAPEIYTSIDGEIQYDDDRSDYYSLGITLITLWEGEQALEQLDERALLRKKKRTQGEGNAPPIPADMPEALQHLVAGLTMPDSEKRWGFNEFERWLRGEEVAIDGYTQSKANSGFSFLWSGSDGKAAHSLEELGALMAADRKLAAKYLYSGKISQALADGGYPELQMEVDEYVNRTYPKNQEAGVMATAYLLNAELPYYSPTGKELSTQTEIAEDMTHNAPKYLDEVAKADSLLYTYFRAGGNDLAPTFTRVAKEKSALMALWRMIFTLDPSKPFPLLDINDGRYALQNTVEEMVEFFANQPEHCYTDCKSMYPELLLDEAFILWLSHRDAALAGKIKSRLEQENNSKNQLYYYVMYLLAPERNLFMGKDKEQAFTLEGVAHQLNSDMLMYYVQGRHDNDYKKAYLDRVNELVELRDNRLYYYLKSKDIYKDKFDYIAYCFDLNSKDRRKAAGPYNLEIAVFKAVQALNGGKSFYWFPKSEKAVWNLDELADIPQEEQLDELRNGLLKWWLAVQYQEDPYADLSEQYAYEDLLNDYTWKLYDIDEENEELDRLVGASVEVDEGAKRIKRMLRSNALWRGVFYIIIGLPMLAVALMAALGGTAHFAHASSFWAYVIVAASLIVPLRLVQSIGKVDEWLLQPFGENLGNDLLLHRWIVSAIYLVAIFGFCYVLEAWGHPLLGRILVPAAALGILAWRYKLTIGDYPLMKSAYDDAINPNYEATVVEPLFYAWKVKDKDEDFDSETLDRQNTYFEGIKSARYFCITRTLWSLFPMALIVAIYIAFSPITEAIIKAKDPERWEKVYGEGTKKTDNEVIGEAYTANVRSSLTVRAKASGRASSLGSLKPGEEMTVVNIADGWAKIVYGDGYGYVNAKYIAPTGEQPTTKGAPMQSATSSSNASPRQAEPQAPEQAPATAPEPVVPQVYTIRHDYNQISVFSAKNTQLQFVIGELKTGDTFEVLSKDGSWTKIEYQGRDAYVRTMLIVPVE